MDDTSKYLIHAAIRADGVVERSDVVGAIFGQTEGLLGDDLDLRDLQQSSKVGRIDVEVDSEAGQSFGHITIASSLDKVETAILAASLETISRVGPCRSEVRVTDIEDVREAKRREVVDRAKELLTDSFNESIMTSSEILEEVRESVRVEDITEYEGLPAGPRVADSDAIIVVEGRADVLTLLKYGIKNALAVEGTNVPDSVAALSQERTVTAFLDGDRGGELILRELAQVGDVDYVAFAPDGRSVEDLARQDVMSALRDKVPYETLSGDDLRAEAAAEDTADPRTESSAATESTAPAGDERDVAETDGAGAGAATATRAVHDPGIDVAEVADEQESDEAVNGDDEAVTDETGERESDETDEAETDESDDEETDEADAVGTLRGVTRDVIGAETGTARLTDAGFRSLATGDAAEAFDLLKDAETVPYAVFIDGELTQRVLDVAAQRGTEHVIARSLGEFVKRPVSVRIRTADQLLGSRRASE